MDGTTFWIVATIAACAIGMGKGGVPLLPALAVPILSLVISPVAAAGLLLPVLIAADIFGAYAYRSSFDRRVLVIAMIAMPVGVFVGYLTVDAVSDAVVTLILGLIGALSAVSMLLRRPVEGPPQDANVGKGLFWLTISGFTSFVSHSGSVPYQIFALPLRMTKLIFAGTVTVAFTYINLVKLIPYYLLGQLNADNLKTTAILMIPAVICVFVGLKMVQVMPVKVFFKATVWALLILSLRLIWVGVATL